MVANQNHHWKGCHYEKDNHHNTYSHRIYITSSLCKCKTTGTKATASSGYNYNIDDREKKIAIESVTQPTTTTSITTTTVQATGPETTTTTTPPVTELTTAITTTQPIPTEAVITTPKNGTIEGDLIWVQGFGWIEYEGGGGIGYYNAEMYMNGNKISYFG